jgi:hypothetical protein
VERRRIMKFIKKMISNIKESDRMVRPWCAKLTSQYGECPTDPIIIISPERKARWSERYIYIRPIRTGRAITRKKMISFERGFIPRVLHIKVKLIDRKAKRVSIRKGCWSKKEWGDILRYIEHHADLITAVIDDENDYYYTDRIEKMAHEADRIRMNDPDGDMEGSYIHQNTAIGYIPKLYRLYFNLFDKYAFHTLHVQKPGVKWNMNFIIENRCNHQTIHPSVLVEIASAEAHIGGPAAVSINGTPVVTDTFGNPWSQEAFKSFISPYIIRMEPIITSFWKGELTESEFVNKWEEEQYDLS